MAEPTVQVPVSLIERILVNDDELDASAAEDELRALLSQPTPTAERMVSVEQVEAWRSKWWESIHHAASSELAEILGTAPPKLTVDECTATLEALAQPTAEPTSPLCLFGHDVFTAGGYCRRCGRSMLADPESPSIADMVPGTTFVQAVMWTVAVTDGGEKYARRPAGRFGSQTITDHDIDSSMIRDIREPE